MTASLRVAFALLVGMWALLGVSAAQIGTDEASAERRVQEALADVSGERALPVFGSQLFNGRSASTRMATEPNYELQKGDRIAVRAFGAYNTDVVEEIDQNGILFIPEVGPVELEGRRAGELQAVIEAAVSKTFTDNVRVYATLVVPGAVGVYVTGDVNKPGRYLGGSSDDVLYYLQSAGGINTTRGSFRDIRVMRGDMLIARIDLYDFLFQGTMPDVDFRSGDVVFVTGRGPLIEASGDVLAPFAYELPAIGFEGARLINIARPEPDVTHVVLSGVRSGRPFTEYLTIADFSRVELKDGDRAEFRADAFGQSIAVAVQSTSMDAQALYVLPRDAKLSELLAITPVEPGRADLQSIHVNRVSVARSQKEALNEALDRLQRAVAFTPGFSAESAQVQRAEAESIARFIEQARNAEPVGTITVVEDGQLADLTLEDGDVVVIPDKTDVVLVAGEVVAPGAFVKDDRDSIRDYINRAGGFQQQANKSDFVVRKRSGAALKVNGSYIPEAGDQILVLPRTGNRGLLLASEVTQVIFQLALSTATVARL
ncbi:polysaccharide biosynthesis/export family protein [Parvularcula lutaonensis]|uniref:Polysaccharide biosynthesis/export family protein n=1 Tax=Parvularcula lutaonensis TaxID=491923 RepID=A0ABV7MFV9_9PROT|nr:polysaccharide biosynthesis/export family protein [Parvularcula lutaonensis]GGY53969.1 capreomycidine hydroxylase [Parvularcula lutaonensis]